MTAQTTLVLGGTGKTGRRVVERLTARKLPVRIGSRSATPTFDWETAHLAGGPRERARRLRVVYPDLAAPGATDAIRAFTEVAVRAACDVWCCCPAAASPRRNAARRSS